MTSGIIILNENVFELFKQTAKFIEKRMDPLFGKSTRSKFTDEQHLSKFEQFLLDAEQGKFVSEDEWCLFVLLISRGLEIVFKEIYAERVADDEEDTRYDLFKLLNLSQADNLLNKEQLDVLHAFRMSRNDLFHGRSHEINPQLVISSAYVLRELETLSHDKIS